MSELAEVLRLFTQHFGDPPPTHLVRAPGRVNLIGDHTDYNGLPVFPMAIQREMRIALRPRRDGRVRMVNAEAEFSLREFELDRAIDPFPAGDWGNYPQAAGQALANHVGGRLTGFDCVVASDIPIAAGLSSSSALVIASALAVLASSGKVLDVMELASLMARGERYVGLQGGGMDQAVCLMGEERSATRIDFDPLRLKLVRVPDKWRFVVAYSLERAAKAGTARETYNRRVLECRQAGEMLADLLGLPRGPRMYPRLMAQISEEDLLFAAGRALDDVLQKRFRHVVTEAERVRQAEMAMLEEDGGRFGALMSESHYSLSDDYGVSSAGLDRLVEICLDAGALGARLTGAGLGGCAVALCAEERLDRVMAALETEFYAPRVVEGHLDDKLFVAVPSRGATVTSID